MLRAVKLSLEHSHAVARLAQTELKTSVATTRLGWIWWIVDPLVMMFIYYFMVKIVFDRGGPNYHLFALCGIVCWQYFTRTLRLTANCLKQNIALMKQVGIPPELYTVVPVFVQMFFALIGVVIIAAWNHSALGWHTLATIPLFVLAGLAAYALGVFFAVCSAWFPDMHKFIDYGLRAGFFLTPILYPASRVLENDRIPQIVKTVFSLNPLSWIITALREVLLDGVMFSMHEFLAWTGAILLATQLSLLLFRRKIPQIIKRL